MPTAEFPSQYVFRADVHVKGGYTGSVRRLHALHYQLSTGKEGYKPQANCFSKGTWPPAVTAWDKLFEEKPKALPNLGLWIGNDLRHCLPFHHHYNTRTPSFFKPEKQGSYFVKATGMWHVYCAVPQKQLSQLEFFAEHVLGELVDQVETCAYLDARLWNLENFLPPGRMPQPVPLLTHMNRKRQKRWGTFL